MTMIPRTVHRTGFEFSQPQWKSSAGASVAGRGFVAARGHIMFTNIEPPHTIARTLTGIPQRPSENGAFVFGHPVSRARRSARLPIR